MTVNRTRAGAFVLAGAFALGCGAALGADLPAETRAILKELKLNEAVLSGIDEEVKMPAQWLAKAKPEGAFNITGSWDPQQFRKLTAPFRARFPDVKISYVRGGRYDRGVKTLLALKQGRFVADVIISPGGDWVNFKAINALEDLQVLPNYKHLSEEVREPNGLWVGQKLAYRCMAYNTKLIKKEDLPKTWDDLLTNTKLRNGKLGVPNRPNLWLSMLWLKNGPDWTRNFINKLFTEVKPQLRKEGANAMIGLTVAGEFHAAVAAAEYRIQQYQERGAPVAFHCPTPVPLAISILMVLKDNPHKYSSLIFTNWFISKEGQIAQYGANNAISVRDDLRSVKELMPFPEEVKGKPVAVRDEEALRQEYPKLIAFYDPLWKRSGGQVESKNALTTVNVKLTGIKRSGRVIVFDVGGKSAEARISGRRTAVEVNGARASRGKLKVGMSCKVTYSGPGSRAASVSCK